MIKIKVDLETFTVTSQNLLIFWEMQMLMWDEKGGERGG